MKRIARKNANHFAISREIPPAITVKPGEPFVIETEDTYSGYIRKETNLPIPEHVPYLTSTTPAQVNPCGGPVYVEGAEKGDLLIVNIIDVVPWKQGFTCFLPGVGPLRDSATWPECRGPFTKIIKHLPGPSGTTSDGKGVFTDQITWDLKPFIGTIATAPERGAENTLYGQGPWGGNMDVRDVCKGTKVYLNSFNEGALLFVGDVHGTQADSELYGLADETPAEVTLSCDIIKKKQVRGLGRLEKADSIVTLTSKRIEGSLEDAITAAFIQMMEWLVVDYGMDKKEAYMHMSVNPDVRINIYQFIPYSPFGTVGVEFPKKCLLSK